MANEKLDGADTLRSVKLDEIMAAKSNWTMYNCSIDATYKALLRKVL